MPLKFQLFDFNVTVCFLQGLTDASAPDPCHQLKQLAHLRGLSAFLPVRYSTMGSGASTKRRMSNGGTGRSVTEASSASPVMETTWRTRARQRETSSLNREKIATEWSKYP